MSRLGAYLTTFLTVAAALGAAVSLAAPPDRADLEMDVYGIRRTWWIPMDGVSYQGLWRFEPTTGEWQRLRPLYFNEDTDQVIPYSHNGYGAFLSGAGDRLVLQVWPATQEWELGTWRLLRRYAPLPPAAVGWVVQGPIVQPELATRLGIQPGTYGFPLCLRAHLTSGNELTQPVPCEPFAFPGAGGELRESSTSLLTLQDIGPPRQLLAGFDLGVVTWRLTPEYAVEVPPTLSLDPETGLLLRGVPRGIEAWALTWPPTRQSETDLPLPQLEDEDLELDLLFYHPRRRQFFCGLRSPLRELKPQIWEFLAFNPDFTKVTSYRRVADGFPLGLPVTLAWAGEAPATYEQLLPIVSRTTGVNGTFWTAELWLYNPSEREVEVTARRVVRPDSANTVRIPAHGSLRVPDALAWLGGGAGGDGVRHDAIVLTSPYRWGANLVAAARVSTPATAGGSYGQAVPGVPGRVGYSNHLPYYEDQGDVYYNVHWEEWRPATFSLDLREPGRFRHNLGVVNDEDEPVEVTLLWGYDLARERDLSGLRPGSVVQHVTVPPHSVHIVSVEGLFPADVRDGWPPRIAVYADRTVALWLSMVDNLTGDATFVPYSNLTLHTDVDGDWYAVPVVAHVPGRESTFWTTTLYGTEGRRLPYEYDTPFAAFVPSEPSGDCGGAATASRIEGYLAGEVGMPFESWLETLREIGYAPSEEWARRTWRTVFPDVVGLFPQCAVETAARGALEVRTGSWTAGFTRTFTVREDGGTYGSMLPFYPPHGWPVQHFAGVEVGPERRVNVGMYNGQRERAVVHRLSLYAADGTLAAEHEVTLAPGASLVEPLETVLGVAPLAPGTYGLTVLPLDDPETGDQGTSWAFVSLVDNVTGDPTNWW